jgi:hypothetical protein
MEIIKKILHALFTIGVITLILISIVIAVAQIYALIILDRKPAISISQKPAKPACIAATMPGVLGFIQGYVFKNKMDD